MGISEIGFEEGRVRDGTGLGMVPSSFATQMAFATGGLGGGMGGRTNGEGEEGMGMMGRLMLVRMKALEEGVAEVVRVVRGLDGGGGEGGDGKIPGMTLQREKSKSKAKRREGMVRTRSEIDVATLERRTSRGAAASGVGIRGGNGGIAELLPGEEIPDTPEGKIIERYLMKGSSL